MGHYLAPLFRRAKVVCIDYVTTSGACSRGGRGKAAMWPLPYNNDCIHVQGVQPAIEHHVPWPSA